MTTTDRRAFDPFAPHITTDPAPDLDALTGVVTPLDAADTPADDDAAVDAAVADVEPLPDNLDELLKPELIALAEQRGVDPSGTKAAIIARLRDQT